jgi:uncharacterized protein
MSFADEYLAQLEAFAALGPLPRVRALHLPPGRFAQDNRGEFCALELEDGSIGLSFVLLDDTLERLLEGAGELGLAGSDTLALARRYAGDSGVWKTLGFAAANALTRCLYDRAGFRPEKSSDSIGHLNPQPGERIGMIGKFTPLLPRILDSGAELTIVELKPELVGEYEGYRVTLDAAQLAGCDKVVSTSTLLLNDSIDRMLGYCRNARSFAMVGPSAGCLPDALFSRGVTLLGGSWIHDGPGFIGALRRGESLSAHAGKSALSPGNYPGFGALLARACGRGS